MKKEFKKLIDKYKSDRSETKIFQIRNESFLTEAIVDEFLELSSFINVNFLDLNFTNVDFASSFFRECSFENCSFDRTLFDSTEFENCSLKNCCFRDCNLVKTGFTEITFDKCLFEGTEESNLGKSWFESCYFLETNFNDFNLGSLLQAAVVDSKFSKFNKSIEFKGEFFLSDILYPDNGIEGMFIES